jgi:hypothetical protein
MSVGVKRLDSFSPVISYLSLRKSVPRCIIVGSDLQTQERFSIFPPLFFFVFSFAFLVLAVALGIEWLFLVVEIAETYNLFKSL